MCLCWEDLEARKAPKTGGRCADEAAVGRRDRDGRESRVMVQRTSRNDAVTDRLDGEMGLPAGWTGCGRPGIDEAAPFCGRAGAWCLLEKRKKKHQLSPAGYDRSPA